MYGKGKEATTRLEMLQLACTLGEELYLLATLSSCKPHLHMRILESAPENARSSPSLASFQDARLVPNQVSRAAWILKQLLAVG